MDNRSLLPGYIVSALWAAAGLALVTIVATVINLKIEVAVIGEQIRMIQQAVARIETKQEQERVSR